MKKRKDPGNEDTDAQMCYRLNESYMCLRFHENHKAVKELRIPTFYDSIKEGWMGVLQTPKTKTLLHFEGKDSFELQNDCNKKLAQILEKGGGLADEIFSMFKKIG